MFKLVKLLIGVVGLGVFVWWGLTVPLGDRTLFEHVSAIGQSKESQELVRGTKLKVTDLKKRIAGDEAASKAELAAGPKAAPRAEPTPAPPQEQLTHSDRKEMRKFIDTARAKIPKSSAN